MYFVFEFGFLLLLGLYEEFLKLFRSIENFIDLNGKYLFVNRDFFLLYVLCLLLKYLFLYVLWSFFIILWYIFLFMVFGLIEICRYGLLILFVDNGLKLLNVGSVMEIF